MGIRAPFRYFWHLNGVLVALVVASAVYLLPDRHDPDARLSAVVDEVATISHRVSLPDMRPLVEVIIEARSGHRSLADMTPRGKVDLAMTLWPRCVGLARAFLAVECPARAAGGDCARRHAEQAAIWRRGIDGVVARERLYRPFHAEFVAAADGLERRAERYAKAYGAAVRDHGGNAPEQVFGKEGQMLRLEATLCAAFGLPSGFEGRT